jgi:RNA polymerase sigma-70 factor (sigma-E family)
MIRSTRDQEFSEFVRISRASLLRTACVLTAGERYLAEDLVQTALAKVYVAWPRIRDSASAEGYARKAVVSTFLDETRRAWRRRERSTGDLPEIESVDEALRGVEDHLDTAAVRRALLDLPPRMRAVVVLRHWLDLSVEETASLLGCTQGTIKSQNARALDRLRMTLAAVTV